MCVPVFLTYVYPAMLSALGVAGNAYFLGHRIDKMEDNLEDLSKIMGGDSKDHFKMGDDDVECGFKGLRNDFKKVDGKPSKMESHLEKVKGFLGTVDGRLKAVNTDIKDIVTRQTEMRYRNAFMVEKIIAGVDKNK